jgi:AcrR family transcriptional regulator
MVDVMSAAGADELEDLGEPRPPTGVRERRRQELAHRIERTALEHFAARGFDVVTGDDIAAAVGVSRRTIFRYFPGGKDEIVLRDLRRRFAAMREDLDGRPPDEPALVALRHCIMKLADGYEGDRELAAMRGRILLGAPSLSARFHGEQSSLTQAFVEIVAVRMGTDPATDPRPALIVATSLGAVQVAFAMWLLCDRDLAVLAGECLDIVDRGLTEAAAGAQPKI